ncbi:carbonic anhydrase 4b [Poecilia latipinna]|uniref:Carbonic anhydrase n=1 Tax=Poecilia latipinna TaxID=48699 RepID=A0A3B3UI24_9TELE|nr:PREDICTED: carbonic anhydrase 4-like [Poecilia latipinna]
MLHLQHSQKTQTDVKWVFTMQLTWVLICFVLSVKTISAAEWCYQSQVSCNSTCLGPDARQKISQQCGGSCQSPVNIVTKKTVKDKRLTPLQFVNYHKASTVTFINNGHTVQLDLPPGIVISGGHLAANYKAIQLHLHWGKNGSSGSEHTLDGEKFPMEMHIVHIKEGYNSLSQAVKDPTGIAVLGFFFQESLSENKKYTPLVDALKQIIKPTSNATLPDISLEMLIPPLSSLNKYFRYNGSLTTPNCNEAVVWTLFESTIPLSRSQVSAFCQLHFPDGREMIQIYRPVQPLNSRLVLYSKGNASLVSWVLLVMSVLLSTVWTKALFHADAVEKCE